MECKRAHALAECSFEFVNLGAGRDHMHWDEPLSRVLTLKGGERRRSSCTPGRNKFDRYGRSVPTRLLGTSFPGLALTELVKIIVAPRSGDRSTSHEPYSCKASSLVNR
jgi:hypothetical protein